MALDSAAAVVAVGFLGGACNELVHWWRLRKKVGFPKYAASAKYWIITVLMAATGGILAFLYFGAQAEALIVFHVGISTPLLIEKLSSSLPKTEGARAPGVLSVRDFFDW